MRIVFLNPVGVIGGAERCLLNMLACLRRAVPAVDLHLVICTPGPLREEAERLGVEVTLVAMPEELTSCGDNGLAGSGRIAKLWNVARKLPGISWSTLRYARRLRRVLRNLRPDLIHSNGNKCHLLSRLAAPGRVPVVWHIHDFVQSRALTAPALRWAMTPRTSAVAISDAIRQDVAGALPRLLVDLLYNVIDTDHYLPGPAHAERLDAAAGLTSPPAGTIRIGLVATYARWKGHSVFLAAAARLVARRPDLPVRFYVVGGPIYRTRASQFTREELSAQCHDLQIADRVGFVPFQTDTVEVYRDLDIVVHASTQPEPFGLTIAEAMSCGRAVVVSQAGGAAELFEHDHDALGTPPGDIDALSQSMEALADSPQLRQQLGLRARQSALARFSRDHLGTDLYDIYEQRCGESHPARVLMTPRAG